MNVELKGIKFDDKGLIPVVVQDFFSKEVLTLAYMNEESLKITLEEKRTCFWSRSRKELWRKGETSGNWQQVVSLKKDCDSDALVAMVVKKGPACHTGKESCFYQELYRDEEVRTFSLKLLYEKLEKRKTNPVEGSYTSYLFDRGMDKILKKIGEESTEVIIGACKEDKEETIYEIADLAYHIMVMMIHMGIDLEQVKKELFSRDIVEAKVKQGGVMVSRKEKSRF